MIKSNEGYILVDSVIALLIISITLTSVYGLVIKSIDVEQRLTEQVNTLFIAVEEYDDELKNIK